MFFLHPKAEKEQESKAILKKFMKYLGIGILAVVAMRVYPKVIKRDG